MIDFRLLSSLINEEGIRPTTAITAVSVVTCKINHLTSVGTEVYELTSVRCRCRRRRQNQMLVHE